ncbi:FAD-dependent oxidoreductase [Leucobacter allii]|uniref:SAM-dependent methyltransferase n=1 Tax=Leucobacter allii TaxID=2932247 RepID=UPI001FD14C05|nr:SAM-dependent methyltransferase [Leucobacter allii]UOR01078.1 FAD-dependent oxidoreductase [Leucobacter allii]
MHQHPYEAIVIGGGAAGLSAAQSLGRALRRTLVIDSGSPRNRFASHMHNALGLDGTPPEEFLARGRAEAERYGATIRSGTVRTVRDAPGRHGEEPADPGALLEVVLEGGEVLATRALVVATGVADVLPEIPGLAERWGATVLHCPYCHGWEVRGARIAVVTTSPLGLHQAKLLRQWSDRVTVFTAGLLGPEGSALDAESERGLRARGVRLVSEPVVEILGEPADDAGRAGPVTAVRTADGREYPVDAVFTMGRMAPRDGFLEGVGVARAETPVGAFPELDPMGRTSHPRIWVAGNAASPAASVPMVMGAGTFAGAAVNAALVDEDLALAARRLATESPESPDGTPMAPHATHRHGGRPAGGGPANGGAAGADPMAVDPAEDPRDFWERRYGDAGPVWSGRVNTALAEVVAAWDDAAGRALDLGCGEGGDAIWLAERGWRATGLDLSETAVARARAAAAARGADGAEFRATDLGAWAEADPGDEAYELVAASFLQSPVALPRETILRAATARVAPGGRIVVISHAAPPSWASGHPGPFPSPDSELAALALDPAQWAVEFAEVRRRDATAPDGSPATLEDTVVVARRK